MKADYDRFLDWQRKECEEEPLVEVKTVAKVKVKANPSELMGLKIMAEINHEIHQLPDYSAHIITIKINDEVFKKTLGIPNGKQNLLYLYYGNALEELGTMLKRYHKLHGKEEKTK